MFFLEYQSLVPPQLEKIKNIPIKCFDTSNHHIDKLAHLKNEKVFVKICQPTVPQVKKEIEMQYTKDIVKILKINKGQVPEEKLDLDFPSSCLDVVLTEISTDFENEALTENVDISGEVSGNPKSDVKVDTVVSYPVKSK